jgi:hypothetical protein
VHLSVSASVNGPRPLWDEGVRKGKSSLNKGGVTQPYRGSGRGASLGAAVGAAVVASVGAAHSRGCIGGRRSWCSGRSTSGSRGGGRRGCTRQTALLGGVLVAPVGGSGVEVEGAGLDAGVAGLGSWCRCRWTRRSRGRRSQRARGGCRSYDG